MSLRSLSTMAVALPHAMSAVEPFDLAAEGAKLEAERSIFISFTAILAWDCVSPANPSRPLIQKLTLVPY